MKMQAQPATLACPFALTAFIIPSLRDLKVGEGRVKN